MFELSEDVERVVDVVPNDAIREFDAALQNIIRGGVSSAIPRFAMTVPPVVIYRESDNSLWPCRGSRCCLILVQNLLTHSVRCRSASVNNRIWLSKWATGPAVFGLSVVAQKLLGEVWRTDTCSR